MMQSLKFIFKLSKNIRFDQLKQINSILTIFRYVFTSQYSIPNKFNTFYINVLSKTKTCMKVSKPMSYERRGGRMCLCFNLTTILYWLGMIDEKAANATPLEMTIKRGILCMQRNEYDKAEIIFHTALTMAQTDERKDEAIHYIYDCMANNAFQKQDWKKAEKLFLIVLSKQLEKVVDQSHESVVEISVKLATIYSKNGDFEKAQHGFRFCLGAMRNKVTSLIEKEADEMGDEEKNSLILWAMILEHRAKHLSSYGNNKDALIDYHQSLSLSQRINGQTHAQTLVLLNDIATAYALEDDLDNAVKYLKKAIDGAIKTDSQDLATFYYNIGIIYLRQLNGNKAEMVCRESLFLSKASEDEQLMKKSKDCLEKARKIQLE